MSLESRPQPGDAHDAFIAEIDGLIEEYYEALDELDE